VPRTVKNLPLFASRIRTLRSGRFYKIVASAADSAGNKAIDTYVGLIMEPPEPLEAPPLPSAPIEDIMEEMYKS
jgi:hypothetical protein